MDDKERFDGLSREEKEAELNKLRASIAGYLADAVETLKTVALEKRELFIRMACESELNLTTAEYNVFTAYRDRCGTDVRAYQDLAGIVRARLDESNNIRDGREYILLADYVADKFDYRNIDWKIFELRRNDPNILVNRYFSSMERDFSLALLWACELVYHGMPLYYVDNEGAHSRLAFEHPDYVYLSKMGENFIRDRTTDLPYWSKKYYIKASDLTAHELFYEHGGEVKAETVPSLRKCLHDRIGISDSDTRQRDPRDATTLLKKVYEVMVEFGEQSPYPKATTIVNWLKQHHGLSERQATSIEIVARPDDAR